MRNVDLIALLELGSTLVYEEANDHGTCPISLSQAGACARALSIKAKSAQRKRIDGTGARIFRAGSDRGKRLARAMELACKERDDVTIVGVEMDHWLTVGQWSVADADRIIDTLKGIHGESISVRGLFTSEGPSLQVLGHSDVVLRIGNTLHVVDFKTANEWALKKVNVNDHTSCNTSYLQQIACYSAALNDVAIKMGCVVGAPTLIFENKNSNELVGPVWLPAACIDQYADMGRANLAEALNAVLRGTPPVRPFAPDSKGKLPWNCDYCDVAADCWGDEIYNSKPGERIPKWVVR